MKQKLVQVEKNSWNVRQNINEMYSSHLTQKEGTSQNPSLFLKSSDQQDGNRGEFHQCNRFNSHFVEKNIRFSL